MLQEADTGLRPPTPDFQHFIALSQIDVRTPSLENGVRPRLEYAGESVEEAQVRVGSIVKGLAEHGEYQTLGSSGFQTDLEAFLSKFPEGSMREDVHYASVAWFVTSVAANIRNCMLEDVHLELSDTQKRATTEHVFSLFKDIGNLQQLLKNDPTVKAGEIFRHLDVVAADTALVCDREGVFHRYHNPDNALKENLQVVFLSIPGLNRHLAEHIASSVTRAPCVGRAIGILPTAILRFIDMVHITDKKSHEYHAFRQEMERIALHQWPDPRVAK